MKEMIQAGNFYDSLEEKDKKELTEAIAESLFFQEEALQKDVVTLLAKADLRLASEVEKRLLQSFRKTLGKQCKSWSKPLYKRV